MWGLFTVQREQFSRSIEEGVRPSVDTVKFEPLAKLMQICWQARDSVSHLLRSYFIQCDFLWSIVSVCLWRWRGWNLLSSSGSLAGIQRTVWKTNFVCNSAFRFLGGPSSLWTHTRTCMYGDSFSSLSTSGVFPSCSLLTICTDVCACDTYMCSSKLVQLCLSFPQISSSHPFLSWMSLLMHTTYIHALCIQHTCMHACMHASVSPHLRPSFSRHMPSCMYVCMHACTSIWCMHVLLFLVSLPISSLFLSCVSCMLVLLPLPCIPISFLFVPFWSDAHGWDCIAQNRPTATEILEYLESMRPLLQERKKAAARPQGESKKCTIQWGSCIFWRHGACPPWSNQPGDLKTTPGRTRSSEPLIADSASMHKWRESWVLVKQIVTWSILSSYDLDLFFDGKCTEIAPASRMRKQDWNVQMCIVSCTGNPTLQSC